MNKNPTSTTEKAEDDSVLIFDLQHCMDCIHFKPCVFRLSMTGMINEFRQKQGEDNIIKDSAVIWVDELAQHCNLFKRDEKHV